MAARMLSASTDTIRLQFTVQDTGISIPPEKRSQLFLPAYRVDNEVTRRTEGTGLGLAICKRIVELMHGEIALEAEDTTSDGTTIHFTAEFGTHK